MLVQAIESLCQPKNLKATVKGTEDLIVVQNALASRKTVQQIMSEVTRPKQQRQLFTQLSNAREVLLQRPATSKLPEYDESNFDSVESKTLTTDSNKVPPPVLTLPDLHDIQIKEY